MPAPKSFLAAVLTFTLAQPTSAGAAPPAPPTPQTQDWEYPELMVAPRASERLEREARIESRRGFSLLWPVWLPGAANLAAGEMQLGQTDPSLDSGKTRAYAGIAVGGGWVVGSYLLALSYRPYASGLEETSRMPRASAREQLARERVAEEWIETASGMGRTLRYLSAATNLIVAVSMASAVNSGTLAQTLDLASVAIALSPLFFETRWNRVAHDQRNFKKRIFRPIASTLWVRTSERASSPALGLSWAF